jgi:ubiquinone biosynthesis monooxygenase Coq7
MNPELAISAWLRPGENLGDRVLKLNHAGHAGENGAVGIYAGQIAVARWAAPELLADLAGFQVHERRHRALFAAEIARRGQSRCRSFTVCAVGGFVLGVVTGVLGRSAIAATTVAVEEVVLRHLRHQIAVLRDIDPSAAQTIAEIVAEETEHRDRFGSTLDRRSPIAWLVTAIVTRSTELVIWLGMHA